MHLWIRKSYLFDFLPDKVCQNGDSLSIFAIYSELAATSVLV